MNTDKIIIRAFIKDHGLEAARKLEESDPEKLAGFFNEIPMELALEVIPQMKPRIMSAVFEKMDRAIVVLLVESMEIHHAVWVLRLLDHTMAASILSEIPVEKSTAISRLLQYFENSVGASMDSTAFTLMEQWTVKEAIEEIRGHKKKTRPELFVVNSSGRLMGVITLSDLITGSPNRVIKSFMNSKIVTLSPETPVHSILDHEDWNSFYALPVVNHESLFLGVIRLEEVRSRLLQSGGVLEDVGQTTANALGELYRIGVEGLLRSANELDLLTRKKGERNG